MHPDLDDFLESALGAIQPVSPSIGRVVVEPDYDVAPVESEAALLASQLTAALRDLKLDRAALSSADGLDVGIDESDSLLKKYLRRITLHSEPVEGSWVEVAPPGNWI